jgi:c-di-GMP-binding flagellar brake protein YcgR
MKKDILQVTQKIDIVETDMNSQKQDVYFSRIEDVREASILITPPFRKGLSLPPRVGRTIAVRVVSDKVPYLFESTLLRYFSDKLPLWEVSKPLEYHKIQLRSDVRLEIGLKVNMEVLDSADEKKIIRALTRDLSAGGVQVVLPELLPVGTIVKINVTLLQDFIFETKGMIVRLTPPLPPLDKYFAGVKFMEVDAAAKKKIISFIFSKQAEKRMKEKEWFG